MKSRHPLSCAISEALTSTVAEILVVVAGIVWVYEEPTLKGVADAWLAVCALLLAIAIYRKDNK